MSRIIAKSNGPARRLERGATGVRLGCDWGAAKHGWYPCAALRSCADSAFHVPSSRTSDTPPPTGWTPALLQRMRFLFWLKFLGVSGFMWLFFIAYFHLLRHPVQPVTVMPLTALDRWIVFEPAAMAAYVSLWLYVGIPAGLTATLRQLVVYGLWIAALCIAGLAVFYVFPTAIPPPQLPADVTRHPGFALLQGVDAAGNACPSLHVATAVFSAIWIERQLRDVGMPWLLRSINWAWVLLIVYSTLAIKQHVVLDAVAGVALALLFAAPSLRWFPHGPRHAAAPVGAGFSR